MPDERLSPSNDRMVNEVADEVLADLRLVARAEGKQVAKQKLGKWGFLGKLGDEMGFDNFGKGKASKEFDKMAPQIRDNLTQAGQSVMQEYADVLDTKSMSPQERAQLKADMKAVTMEMLQGEVKASVQAGGATPGITAMMDPRNQQAIRDKFEDKMMDRLAASGFIQKRAVDLAINNPGKLVELMQKRPELVNEQTVSAIMNDDRAVESIMNSKQARDGLLADPNLRGQLMANEKVQAALASNPAILADVLRNPTVQQELAAKPEKVAEMVAKPGMLEGVKQSGLLPQLMQNEAIVQAIAKNPQALDTVAKDPQIAPQLLTPQVMNAIAKDPAALKGALGNSTVKMAVLGNEETKKQFIAAVMANSATALPVVMDAAKTDPAIQAALTASMGEMLKNPAQLTAMLGQNPALLDSPLVQAELPGLLKNEAAVGAIIKDSKVLGVIAGNKPLMQEIVKNHPKIIDQVLANPQATQTVLGQKAAVEAIVMDDKALTKVLNDDKTLMAALQSPTVQEVIKENPQRLQTILANANVKQELAKNPMMALGMLGALGGMDMKALGLEGGKLMGDLLKNPQMIQAVMKDDAMLAQVASNKPLMKQVLAANPGLVDFLLDDKNIDKLKIVARQKGALEAVLEDDKALAKVMADKQALATILMQPGALETIGAHPKGKQLVTAENAINLLPALMAQGLSQSGLGIDLDQLDTQGLMQNALQFLGGAGAVTSGNLNIQEMAKNNPQLQELLEKFKNDGPGMLGAIMGMINPNAQQESAVTESSYSLDLSTPQGIALYEKYTGEKYNPVEMKAAREQYFPADTTPVQNVPSEDNQQTTPLTEASTQLTNAQLILKGAPRTDGTNVSINDLATTIGVVAMDGKVMPTDPSKAAGSLNAYLAEKLGDGPVTAEKLAAFMEANPSQGPGSLGERLGQIAAQVASFQQVRTPTPTPTAEIISENIVLPTRVIDQPNTRSLDTLALQHELGHREINVNGRTLQFDTSALVALNNNPVIADQKNYTLDEIFERGPTPTPNAKGMGLGVGNAIT